jgi:hypothetical protein
VALHQSNLLWINNFQTLILLTLTNNLLLAMTRQYNLPTGSRMPNTYIPDHHLQPEPGSRKGMHICCPKDIIPVLHVLRPVNPDRQRRALSNGFGVTLSFSVTVRNADDLRIRR